MNELEARAIELFEASLAIEREKRCQWVAGQTAGDEQLALAVEKLRVADQEHATFLERPVTIVPGLRNAQRVGRWRIERLLAEGGMGAVYLVRRADGTFDQEGALKLIRPAVVAQSASVRDDLIDRFEIERQILARVNHDNVARILDGGSMENGTPYLVMEYIAGVPITQYCEDHALSVRARLRLFLQILYALAAVHRNLIVHRDLKPSNILVNADGDAKLLDFGIAKVLISELAADGLDAPTRFAALTPDYASPEQIRGQTITTASDIYSAGLLLYQLLAGHQAYELATRTPAEAERIVCDTDPMLPSAMLIRAQGLPVGLDPSVVRGEVDQVVMRALQKDPDRRYPSATAMAADIENFLQGKPVSAHADSWAYRAKKFVLRHRTPVAAASFGLFALIAALGVVIWQSAESNKAARRADASNQFLTEMLMASTPYANHYAVTLLDAIQLAESNLRDRFLDQPELEADLRQVIGMSYQSLGHVDEGEKQFRRALEVRRAVGDNVDIAESLHGMGLISWWRIEYDEAEERFRDALQLADTHDDDQALEVRSNLLNDLGAMLAERGRYRQALPLLRLAKDLAEQLGLAPASRRSISLNLSGVLGKLGQTDAALQELDVAADLSALLRRDVDPDYAIVLNNRGNLLLDQNRPDEAVQAFRAAVESHRQSLGDDTYLLIYPIANLSRAQLRLGDASAALASARTAVDQARRTAPKDSPYLARALLARATAEDAAGLQQAALESVVEAEKIYLATQGPEAEMSKVAGDLRAKLENTPGD